MVTRRVVTGLQPLFSSSVHVNKSGSWDAVKNTGFTESPSVTGSVYFVNDNRFALSYASEKTSSLYSEYLIWNSLMDSLGTPYDIEDGRYNFYFANERIDEAIVISFNPDNLVDGMDYDNFFLVMSGSGAPSVYSNIANDGSFNVTNNLVLAPYYIKDSIDDLYLDGNERLKSNQMSPVYELRTNTTSSFMRYDSMLGSITIDWTVGTASVAMGALYPDLGVVLLFPQKFGRTQITNVINNDNNRALNSLYSLHWMGGYSTKKTTKKIYFVRLMNNEYNEAFNKTQFTITDNEITLNPFFETEPTSFITQIGFYNDQNELLVLGSLSQPFIKDETEEKVIKVEIEM
jgi:hypothetical protein